RKAISALPKHFHGRRRGRLATLSLLASQGYAAQDRRKLARRYAKLAVRLDPASIEAQMHRDALEAPPVNAIPAARTASIAGDR
ncbi:MAG: hypothetical protein AAFN74_27270, partial [Myxococcota bacterium]